MVSLVISLQTTVLTSSLNGSRFSVLGAPITPGLVVVAVLLGLQAAGILAVVRYIYSVPTWTATLGAMAAARITRQLPERDGGFLRSGVLRRPTPEQIRQMQDMEC